MRERPANDGAPWTSRSKGYRFSLGQLPILLAIIAATLAIGIWIGMSLGSDKDLLAFMQPQVKVEVIRQGSGPSPGRNDVALINYKGSFPDGKVFDQGKNAVLPLAGVVPGFSDALVQMQKGGKYEAFVPSKLAYGAAGKGSIPPNADLIFEIELLDFMDRATFDKMQKTLQELRKNGPQGLQSAAPEAGG